MQFANNSGELIKSFIPYIKEKENNTKFDKILLMIYHDILNGDKFVTHKIQQSCFKKHIRGKTELLKSSLLEGKFVPIEIRNYIKTKTIKQLTYKCHIHDRVINVIFSLFSENDLELLDRYDECVNFIYTWLYICQKYSSKKCSKEITIFLNFTPYKKELPANSSQVIGVEHVNTALTYSCSSNGEMLIFRQEEWMKVFIHETFHSFGFDLGLQNNSGSKTRMHSLFEIESDFEIAECYTEVWARILNSAFNSFYSITNTADRDEFLLYMHFCLQVERLMSINQLFKVLNFMGLSYKNIYEKNEVAISLRRNLYRENSNVFAYYVLGGIMMNNVYLFLNWCLNNNTSLFQFSNNSHSVNKFIDLIIKEHTNKTLLGTINKLSKINSKKKFIRNNLRMSAIEYFI